MIISVCGTPGTGKTTVSKVLAKKFGYSYIDLNKFSINAGLVMGKDPERDSFVINSEKLKNMQFNQDSVVDGHLSHFVNSDVTVILRTEPKQLKERLKTREWPKKKVEENFEAEVMGVCSVEARELNDMVIDVDTTDQDPEHVGEIIAGAIKSRKLKTDPIDWDVEKYLIQP